MSQSLFKAGRAACVRSCRPAARSIEPRRAIESASIDLNLDWHEVLLQRSLVDLDSQARRLRERNLARVVRQDVVDAEIPGQRLWRERVFTDRMPGQSGIGLERSAERQVRREGVIDVRHA